MTKGPGNPDAEAARTRQTGPAGWLLIGFAAALMLVAAGRHLMGPADPWAGFAILALLVFAFLTRGRALSEFTIGKDGISGKLAELERKAETAVRAAGEAKAVSLQVQQDSVAVAGAETRAAVEATPVVIIGRRQRGPAPPNDPQKNQWGGEQERNGRRLSATVVARGVGADVFDITLWVEPVPGSPALQSAIRFHLHDSFMPQLRRVDPAGGRAELHLIAWGAFTAGAEVEGEPDTFLELDLAELASAPPIFRSR